MSQDFLDSVEHCCKGMHVAVGAAASCDECLDNYDVPRRDERGRFRSVDAMQQDLYEMETSGFSWSECDTCGSSFGGDRHDAHGDIDGRWYHLRICTDCLMYFANGGVPEEWCANPGAARAAH